MTISSSTFDSPRDSERERNQRRFDDVRDDDDTTFDDERTADERADERERAVARQGVADRAAAPNGNFGTSYLGGSTDEHWQQWRQIQSDFVDNPRSAVSNAHRLVGDLMDDIIKRFEGERNQLESRWS